MDSYWHPYTYPMPSIVGNFIVRWYINVNALRALRNGLLKTSLNVGHSTTVNSTIIVDTFGPTPTITANLIVPHNMSWSLMNTYQEEALIGGHPHWVSSSCTRSDRVYLLHFHCPPVFYGYYYSLFWTWWPTRYYVTGEITSFLFLWRRYPLVPSW